MHHGLMPRPLLVAALCALGLAGLLTTLTVLAAPAGGHRAVVPMVARDLPNPAPTPSRPVPPPPGPGYCGPSGQGAPIPPNAVFGKLSIGGVPAPAGTLVTLAFDGQPGPSAYTAAAGGYRVDYAAGGAGHDPPCINQVGTEIGLLVGGALVSSGRTVGDPETGLALRFDVAIP
jgi:hypothetical protein